MISFHPHDTRRNTHVLDAEAAAFVDEVFFTAPVQVRSATIQKAELRPEQLEDRVVPANTFTWLGAPNGAAGDWNVAADWFDKATGDRSTGNVLPGAQDTVVFNKTQNFDCTVTGATQVGTLELNGYTGTLKLNANLTVGGGSMATPILAKTATITGAANLVIGSGTFTWNSGTMAGTGQTVVSGGATLNIASGTVAANNNAVLAGRTLTIETVGSPTAPLPGTVNLSSGQLVLQNDLVALPAPIQAATITNYGNFNITGSATGISSTGSAVFNNFTNAKLGTGTVTLNITNAGLNFTMGVAFNNQSTVTLTNGSLVLNNGGTSAGTWQIGQPSVLSFQNGAAAVPFTWNTSTFSGAGVLQIAGPTINVQAAAGTNIPPQITWAVGTSLYWRNDQRRPAPRTKEPDRHHRNKRCRVE